MKLPPLPADPIGARFCKIFNHPWNFLVAPVPEPGERPAWKTETGYPLQPRDLWDMYCDPTRLLGLRFGKETRYILLDIDRGSRYHFLNDPSQFKFILDSLERIGLCRPLVVQSSDRGGIHIYFFLPEPMPTFGLACAIKFALFDAGVVLQPGEIESFPNVKAYSKTKFSNYNAHRLPLQVGSWLLDDDFEPLTNAPARFLALADTAAANQDLTELEAAISTYYQRQRLTYTPGTSNRAAEWKCHLENRIAQGWTGSSQTNELLKDFAVYGVVWLGLDGQALVEHVVTTAVSAPEYQQFCSHQQEIQQRAADWSRAAESYYSPYCSYPNRKGTYKQTFDPSAANNIVDLPKRPNAQRHQQTQGRIRQVVAHLEASGTLPAAATARSAAIISASKELHGIGASQTTLHKQDYLPLWHPKHYAKSGVIATLEPALAVSTELKIESIPDPWLEPESLKAAPLREKGENYTLLPLMKVLLLSAASDAPQAQSDTPNSGSSLNLSNLSQATTYNNSKSELSSGVGDFGHKQPLSLEAATASRIEPTDFRQVAKLRVQAISHAQKTVKREALSLGRMICGSERARFEQIARMEFYCQSGEPLLIFEAREWAAANPSALPEIAARQPNQNFLVNHLTPPNNSPEPPQSPPPGGECAPGVDEILRPISPISPEKSKLVDSCATKEPPTEPSALYEIPGIEA